MKLKTLHGQSFYHQTSHNAVKSILANGFSVEHGGNQRFTEGIYFLDHPSGHYGDATLQCPIHGDFVDLSDDRLGHKWNALKKQYPFKNYTELTTKIRTDFPLAIGILFPSILVVWNPTTIDVKQCKIIA